ncbi:MAG: PilZ domain-containing protein [Candidatus Omnitrophota bacterium]
MAQYTGTEKRRSPRVPNGTKARITGKHIRKIGSVLNISRHGALLRSRSFIKPEEVVNISVYLPSETRPIDIKGRVIRTVTTCSAWGFCKFNVGIEFLNVV